MILFASNKLIISSSQFTGQLVKTGFTNWKKAQERFNKHNCSENHTQSALKFDNCISLMESKIQSIDNSIDKEINKQAEENRE